MSKRNNLKNNFIKEQLDDDNVSEDDNDNDNDEDGLNTDSDNDLDNDDLDNDDLDNDDLDNDDLVNDEDDTDNELDEDDISNIDFKHKKKDVKVIKDFSSLLYDNIYQSKHEKHTMIPFDKNNHLHILDRNIFIMIYNIHFHSRINELDFKDDNDLDNYIEEIFNNEKHKIKILIPKNKYIEISYKDLIKDIKLIKKEIKNYGQFKIRE